MCHSSCCGLRLLWSQGGTNVRENMDVHVIFWTMLLLTPNHHLVIVNQCLLLNMLCTISDYIYFFLESAACAWISHWAFHFCPWTESFVQFLDLQGMFHLVGHGENKSSWNYENSEVICGLWPLATVLPCNFPEELLLFITLCMAYYWISL